MRHGHFSRIITAKLVIELYDESFHPGHSAVCMDGATLKQLRGDGNRRDASRGCHCTDNNRKRVPNCLRAEEGRLPPILGQL